MARKAPVMASRRVRQTSRAVMERFAHIAEGLHPLAVPIAKLLPDPLNWYPIMDSLQTLQFYRSGHSRNLYSDSRFDELFDAASSEFDLNKRVELMQRAHAYLRDQAVNVWLYESPDVFGVGKNVVSFTPTADGRIHFDTVQVT